MDPLGDGASPWADTPAQPPSTTQQTDDAAAASKTPSEGGAAAGTPTAGGSGTSSSTRAARLMPRRLLAQPTKLQAVEDDPLGPLGAAAGNDPMAVGAGEAAPPMPPQKETLPVRTTMPQQQRRPDAEEDEDGEGVGGRREPPPVQVAQPSPVRTSTAPSVSVEQAAKPSFYISVGDPHKVGDLTSSHIVYSVRTKVC